MAPGAYDAELKAEMKRLGDKMLSPDWLRFPRKPRPLRKVKLRADVFEHRAALQTPRGVLEASYLIEEGVLCSVELAGPAPTGLAAQLEGLRQEEAARLLKDNLIPGVEPKAWLGLFGLK
jgi:hypothetical protein